MVDTWIYRGRVEHVVDGDTVDVQVDQGFQTTRRIRLRLKGLDTAEIYGVKKESDEYKRGIEHKEFVEDWVEKNDPGLEWPFLVKTEKDRTGKFGRYIAEIVARDGLSLNRKLISEFPEVES